MKKLTNKIISLILCFVTCGGYVASTYTLKSVYAKGIEGDYSDYSPDELSSYLTYSDIGDNEIEEEEERIHSKYNDYVETVLNEEGNAYQIVLKGTPLKQYFEYRGYDENEYEHVMKEPEITDELLDFYNLSNYEEDVKDEWIINYNIDIINEAVADDIGYVEDGEFKIYEEDTFASVARWTKFYKSFKLTWYKVYVELDSNATMAVSFSFLLANILNNIRNVKKLLKELEHYAMVSVGRDTTEVEFLIGKAKDELQSEVVSKIVSFFESDVVDYVVNAIFDFIDIIGGAGPLDLLLKVVFRYFIPSVSDCMILMVNSLVYGMGMSLNMCWFRWNEKIGTTARSICF